MKTQSVWTPRPLPGLESAFPPLARCRAAGVLAPHRPPGSAVGSGLHAGAVSREERTAVWTPGEPPQRWRGLCGRAAGRTRAACPEPRVTVGGALVDRPWPPEEHGALATSASRATFCLCASAFSSHLWFSLHPSGGSQAGRPPPRRCARERGEAGGAPGRPARTRLAALRLPARCPVWVAGVSLAPWRPWHCGSLPAP